MNFKSTRLKKEFQLGKITVFLGANGTGKSSLLNEIKEQQPEGGKKVVYIEGGRTIIIKDQLNLGPANFQQYENYETALQTYEGKKSITLSGRVFDALVMLERKDLSIKAEHSDRAEAWRKSGSSGPYPIRDQAPLERLFNLFQEIFPSIKIEYSPKNKTFTVTKKGGMYGPSKMSDGEKQVFSILADFTELDEKYGFVIVDEPELNLHPDLAERLWSLIEREFPEPTYVYATHSIGFAIRKPVDKIYILSEDPEKITEFTDFDAMEKQDLKNFLGSVPGIISANEFLITEGDEKSFDAIFYRWVLGNSQIEILPGGGCGDVLNISNKNGIWKNISSRLKHIGVIDKDDRTEEYLKEMKSPNTIILDYHEAESYLCFPDLIVKLGKSLGLKKEAPEEQFVINTILLELNENKESIACRVAALNTIKLSVSIKRSEIRGCVNLNDFQNLLERECESQLDSAEKVVGKKMILGIFTAKLLEIENILATKNWDSALKHVSGKSILSKLCAYIGVKNMEDLARAASLHLAVGDFPKIIQIRENISRHISPSPATSPE